MIDTTQAIPTIKQHFIQNFKLFLHSHLSNFIFTSLFIELFSYAIMTYSGASMG
jgi:hypothetical protein